MTNLIYNSYFYIIQHIETKIYYAGVRYAKNCNPNELLIKGGYYTSSDIVRKIISESGIESFIIRKIKQFQSQDIAINYETKFLKKVNARDNNTFFNMHNNNAIRHNSEKQKQTCLDRYGVEYSSQIPGAVEKRKQTMINKYGENYAYQTTESLEKQKQTCLDRYGVEYSSQIPEVVEKRKQTNLDRFGLSCVLQRPDIKDKADQTRLERYGTKAPLQNPKILIKTRKSCMNTLGVEFPLQSPEIRKRGAQMKHLRANREIVQTIKDYHKHFKVRLQPGWYQMADEILQNILDNYIERFGVLNTHL